MRKKSRRKKGKNGGKANSENSQAMHPLSLNGGPKRCVLCPRLIRCPNDIDALEGWQRRGTKAKQKFKLGALYILPLCASCLQKIQGGRLQLETIIEEILNPKPIFAPKYYDPYSRRIPIRLRSMIRTLELSRLVILALVLLGIALSFSVFDIIPEKEDPWWPWP